MSTLFAPHSPGYEWLADHSGCFAVLDGRKLGVELTDEVADGMLADAAKFMGSEYAEISGGISAGDFICGTVIICYFRPCKLPEEPNNFSI